MKVTCEPKHIRTVNSDKTSKLAYASITLDDAFVVHGLSIINGREGLFVSMPQSSYTAADGTIKYRDIFHPVTATARQKLIGATVSAYHDALQQQAQAQTQKAAQSESPNAAPRDAPIMQM